MLAIQEMMDAFQVFKSTLLRTSCIYATLKTFLGHLKSMWFSNGTAHSDLTSALDCIPSVHINENIKK